MVRNERRDAAMLEQYVSYLRTRVARQEAVVAQLRECGLDPREDEAVLANLAGAVDAVARRIDERGGPAGLALRWPGKAQRWLRH